MGGIGASSGALLGGILTQTLGWAAIFAVNVPLGAIAIILGLRVVPVGETPAGPRHFDMAGAVLVTAGLVGLVYGIVRSDALGWGSAGVARSDRQPGIALLAAFVRVEGTSQCAARPAGDLPPRATARREPHRAPAVRRVFAMWFFMSLYLQQVIGIDAMTTGLEFLPMTGSVVPRFAHRAATRQPLRRSARPCSAACCRQPSAS